MNCTNYLVAIENPKGLLRLSKDARLINDSYDNSFR